MHISFKDLPGTSKLFQDFLYDFPKVAEFYRADFKNLKNFTDLAEEIQKKKFPLKILSQILKKQNQSPKALENIEALEKKGALTVFTGQQTGLFGGPIYTLYKAISCIKLSEKLSVELKVPVIPVFWLATDDHDFLEVNHIFLIDKKNRLQKFEFQPQKDISGKPVFHIELDQNISATIQNLEENLPETDFKEQVLERLKNFYTPSQKITWAFKSWMELLLGKYGLVFLDPGVTEFKSLAIPIFKKEISENGQLNQLLENTNSRLQSKGYHLQVQKKSSQLNLFLINARRVPIKKEEADFQAGTQKYSKSQLLELIEKQPEIFSPNVFLRPVLQSFLFPALAYVGGPAEIAYFAQIKAMYNHLDTPMPLVFPRVSLSILEKKVESVLHKFELNIKDFSGEVEQTVNSVLKKSFPENWEGKFKRVKEKMQTELSSLSQEIEYLEPTLKNSLEGTKGKIEFELKKVEEKLFAAHKKKNESIREQLHKAKNILFPENTLQERKLNILYFLVKYNFDFIDRLYSSLDIDNLNHQILKI